MEIPTSHPDKKNAKLVFLLANAHNSFKKGDRFDWYLQQVLEHKPLLQKRVQSQKQLNVEFKNDSENIDSEHQQPTKIEETNEVEIQSKSQESLNDDTEHSSSKNDQQDDSQAQDESDTEPPTDEQQQSGSEKNNDSEDDTDEIEGSHKESETDNSEEEEDVDSQPFDIYHTVDEDEQPELPTTIDQTDEFYVEVGFQPYDQAAILYALSQDGVVFSQYQTIAKNNLFQDICTSSTSLVEPSEVQAEIQRNNTELSTMQLTSDSQVFVIYTKYRMVVSLDISPSTSLVCESGAGKLVFDNLFASLQYTLRSAVQPLEFKIGTDTSFKVIYANISSQQQGFSFNLCYGHCTRRNDGRVSSPS